MKHLLLALCLSLSTGVFAQDLEGAKKVACSSGTVSFSFEYDHSYFRPPSMINIKVPHSDAEKLIYELTNSRLTDKLDDSKAVTLSAEGDTFLTRRFFKPKQNGSYAFRVVKKGDENKASGTLSYTSEKDGYQIVDHKVECTISDV